MITTADEHLMSTLGIEPNTGLGLETTAAAAVVDDVLDALAAGHVRIRPGVRVAGETASPEQARALFELLTARPRLARRTRDGRVLLTRAGRAWRHQLRRKGVVAA